jgi:hypothetical protein
MDRKRTLNSMCGNRTVTFSLRFFATWTAKKNAAKPLT